MHRAITVLAGLLLSGSAIAQTTPNWALHYVPPPAEWNGLWASKQDYNAPGKFTTLTTVGNATITGNLTVTGTINGGGGSFLPLTGGTLSGNLTGTTSTFTSGVTAGGNTVAAPFVALNGNGTSQLGLQFKVANVNRWKFIVADAESGSNTGSDFIVQNFSDAGAGLGNLLTINRATGFLQHNAQMFIFDKENSDTWGVAGFAAQLSQRSGRGSKLGATFGANNTGYVYTPPPVWTHGATYAIGNSVTIGTNFIIATSAGVAGGVTPTCSKTVATCSDGGVSWSFDTPIGVAYQVVGSVSGGTLTNNYGATATGYKAFAYGDNPICNISVPFTLGCIGSEIDVLQTAISYSRIGLQIVALGTFASPATVDDVAERYTVGVGAPGWKHIQDWGSRTSQNAIDPSGYGLRVWSEHDINQLPSNMIAAGALDLTEFQPSGTGEFGGGFILRGPGSQILGSGDFQSNYALLHQTATGASLDVSQFHVTAVAVHAGGGGTKWVSSGALADCSDGSVVKITSVAGGAVTGVSLWIGAYANASIATITCTSEFPAGGLDDAGNSLMPDTVQVDATWTQANSGSPVLALGGTATVTAATASVDTNTTQLASTAFVLGQAASATPLINGTAAVGTSTRYARADHVHPTDTTRAALTGATFTGGVNVGNNTTSQTLQVNGPSGVGRPLKWATAGVTRWQLNANATAEGGANAGTDFTLSAFDDSGALLSTPFTVTRSTGTIAFGTLVRFNGSSVVANGAIATTMTSLGPTGSHTTIQEWLSVQNASGTTRYIPLY